MEFESRTRTSLLAVNKFVENFYNNDCVNQVLLYGADNEAQRKEVALNNLFCIQHTVSHASKSIDLCIPKLSNTILSTSLSDLMRKVAMRLVIGKDNRITFGKWIKRRGIEIKVTNSDVEHEFLLVDAIGKYQDSIAMMGND